MHNFYVDKKSFVKKKSCQISINPSIEQIPMTNETVYRNEERERNLWQQCEYDTTMSQHVIGTDRKETSGRIVTVTRFHLRDDREGKSSLRSGPLFIDRIVAMGYRKDAR